jgi:hypothetical protein
LGVRHRATCNLANARIVHSVPPPVLGRPQLADSPEAAETRSWHARCTDRPAPGPADGARGGERTMIDLALVIVTLGFFALGVGYAALLDRL